MTESLRCYTGSHRVHWGGQEANGASTSAGVYFVRLSTPGSERVLRLLRIE